MPSKQNRIKLSELEPETDYSLTIQGQNVAGSSPISNSIRFRTKPIGKYKLLDIACIIVLVPLQGVFKLMLEVAREQIRDLTHQFEKHVLDASIDRINMKCHFLLSKLTSSMHEEHTTNFIFRFM